MDAFARGLGDQGRRQDGLAVEPAVIGQGADQACQGRGGGVAVGGGDFDAPPLGLAAAGGRGPGGQEGRLGGGVDLAEVRQAAWPLQVGDAAVLGVGQADPEVEAEGTGQVLAQGGSHGAPVDPAEDLAGQVAEGDRVVAAGRSRRPQRGHGGQPGADRVPVEPQRELHLLGEAREALLMAHHLFDGDLALAGLGELRPDVGDGLGVVELSGVDQPGDQQRRHRLGGREHRRQGALVEGLGALAVGEAGPEVDDQFAALHEGKARAQLLAGGEVRLEGGADGGEALGAEAVDLRGHANRSKRTLGEVAFSRWAMATMGSSAAPAACAAATVSATPPTARPSA